MSGAITKTVQVRQLLGEGKLSQKEIASEVGCDQGLVSRLALGMRLRDVAVDPPKAERIAKLILGLGELSAKEIALLTGSTENYVHQQAVKVNRQIKNGRGGMLLPKSRCVAVTLSEENFLWLSMEMEATGLSVVDLINGIVTDARCGDG